MYQVVFILGVPGAHDVSMAEVSIADFLRSGDSLIAGNSTSVEKHDSKSGRLHYVEIEANRHGRLARVKVKVWANGIDEAEDGASGFVLPMLSWLAFTTDTALDAVAVVIVEEATGTMRARVTLPGQVQPAPASEKPTISHPDMEKYFSAYREGLSSNSPLYQAVAFHKLIEGVRNFDVNRERKNDPTYKAKNGLLTTLTLPASEEDLPYNTPWELEPFKPFLGKTFEKVWNETATIARDASVHINPGQDIRVADYLSDIRKCQETSPVLRHIARILIEHELRLLDPDATGTAATDASQPADPPIPSQTTPDTVSIPES